MVYLSLGSIASLLADILYQGNPDKNHKLKWSVISTERYIILYMQVLLESSQWENWNHVFFVKFRS